MVSVALVGTVEEDRWVSRAGGKVGDALFVTGKLGGSIGGEASEFHPANRRGPLAER
jgi:thiamine-monophosphate kinase